MTTIQDAQGTNDKGKVSMLPCELILILASTQTDLCIDKSLSTDDIPEETLSVSSPEHSHSVYHHEQIDLDQ
jgi:hypothetical protein